MSLAPSRQDSVDADSNGWLGAAHLGLHSPVPDSETLQSAYPLQSTTSHYCPVLGWSGP